MPNRLKITTWTCVAVVLLAAVIFLVFVLKNSDNKQISSRKQQATIQAQDNQKKADVINGSKGKGDQAGYTPPTDSNGITLSPSIDGNQVVLHTKLVGYSDGTCSLAVINGTLSYNASALVIYQPEFSTCAGFTIPISKLGSGLWSFTVTVTSGGASTQKVATLEVQ